MKRLTAWLFAGALFAFAAAPVAVLAQDDEGEEVDAAEDRAMTMEAAEDGAQTENIPGGMLMVSAYGVVWLLVLGYVASLGFRQARVAQDLERLREDVKAAAKGGDED